MIRTIAGLCFISSLISAQVVKLKNDSIKGNIAAVALQAGQLPGEIALTYYKAPTNIKAVMRVARVSWIAGSQSCSGKNCQRNVDVLVYLKPLSLANPGNPAIDVKGVLMQAGALNIFPIPPGYNTDLKPGQLFAVGLRLGPRTIGNVALETWLCTDLDGCKATNLVWDIVWKMWINTCLLGIKGDWTIRSTILGLPPTTYGLGTKGTGNKSPKMSYVDIPQIGNTFFSVSLHDAKPMSGAFVFMGAGRASIPIFGGHFLINPAIIQSFTCSTTKQGASEKKLAIPNNSSLVGARLNFQYLVNDPKGNSGIALSNGLEIVIHK